MPVPDGTGRGQFCSNSSSCLPLRDSLLPLSVWCLGRGHTLASLQVFLLHSSHVSCGRMAPDAGLHFVWWHLVGFTSSATSLIEDHYRLAAVCMISPQAAEIGLDLRSQCSHYPHCSRCSHSKWLEKCRDLLKRSAR